jgi:hypothetical protein
MAYGLTTLGLAYVQGRRLNPSPPAQVTTLCICAFTSTPNQDGTATHECADANYARQPLTLANITLSGGVGSNAVVLTFGSPYLAVGQTIVAWGICTASSGDNVQETQANTTSSISPLANQQFDLPINALTITLS